LKNQLKTLGFSGSLRVGSYNKALLRAAIDLLPEDVTLEIFDLIGIPAFNQDLESDMPTKIKGVQIEYKGEIRCYSYCYSRV
jgi:chromate reductase